MSKLRDQAHLIKIQIANFSITHQGTYQALQIERNVISERYAINQNLQKMEVMRNELSLSEEELQIQDLDCRMQQRQDEVDLMNNKNSRTINDEKQRVMELTSKSHMLAEALGDKINRGLMRKCASNY